VAAYTAAAILLAAAYLIQAFTPLRLHYDSLVLLTVAESAASGHGFLYHGQPTVFPPAYPALIAVLLRAGAFGPWTVVVINVVFLALGLAASAFVLRRFFTSRATVWIVCLMMALSFVVIRHATIPLTDIVFFAVAMGALAAMEQARASSIGPAFWGWLMLSAALVLLGIAVRRIGVSLAAPLLWTVLSHSGRRRHWTALSTWCGAAFVAIAWTTVQTSTLRDRAGVVEGQSAAYVVSHTIGFRLRELGELALNVPSAILPAPAIFVCAGAVVALLVAVGVARRSRPPGPAEVFLGAYTAVLLMWPYYDPRFWLPLIPLLIAYAALGAARAGDLARTAADAYLLLFAVLGVFVLVASTRTTFAGPNFPDAYGDREFHATYCAAFGTCTGTPNEKPVNVDGLRLLQTYR
jgi:hypothetical protein